MTPPVQATPTMRMTPQSQATAQSQTPASTTVATQRPQGTAEQVDWKAVEQALGKSGQLQPKNVYRIGLPRTDLNVTIAGVPVKATFALGSYAAFRPMDNNVLVMGDLVLLDSEVNAVMSGLFEGGLAIAALHNHLLDMTPHVMYLHYSGSGDPVGMAAALKKALGARGTPFGTSPPSSEASGPQLDTKQIEKILRHTGKSTPDGIFQVGVPRREKITEMGMELPPAMGTAIAINFQPTGDRKAAITGDFVLAQSEANPVARALREHGIDVTAVHNHALADDPRTFYMHYWANKDAIELARGLRSALDKTNTATDPAAGL